MATDITDFEEDSDLRRPENQTEVTSSLVPEIQHHGPTDQVGELDQPPPPPPPPEVPVSTCAQLKPRGCGQWSQKRLQKELRFKLTQAIETGDLSALHHLISEGAQLDCIIMFSRTPLTYAIEKGNFMMAKLMVQSGADVNFRQPYANAQRPLHRAVLVGSYNLIEFLLQNGADVNGRNGCGLTPVMLASYLGHLKAIELLHAHGADLNAEDNVGKTALHRAAERQHGTVIEFLLVNRADINAVDMFGRTALFHSIIFQYVDIVELLLRSGISVNGTDVYDQSPLHVAVPQASRHNIRATVATSVDYHNRQKIIPTADVHMLLSTGETEGTILADFEIIQLLVNAGAVLDFSRLGNYFFSFVSPAGTDVSDLKIALWQYLIVCDCASDPTDLSAMSSCIKLPVLETCIEKKRSLQQLCRTAVRSHLRRQQPCDIQSCVSKLPIPESLKDFLNLSDFFYLYPQFVPLSSRNYRQSVVSLYR